METVEKATMTEFAFSTLFKDPRAEAELIQGGINEVSRGSVRNIVGRKYAPLKAGELRGLKRVRLLR